MVITVFKNMLVSADQNKDVKKFYVIAQVF